MSTSERCYLPKLVKVYGINYFAASVFSDEFREEWLKRTAYALGVPEDDFFDHMMTLRGTTMHEASDSEATDATHALKQQLVEYMMATPGHKEQWAALRAYFFEGDKSYFTTSKKLKEVMQDVRSQTSIDYYALFREVYSDETTIKQIVMPKSNKMLFECDATLARYVYAFRRRHVVSKKHLSSDADAETRVKMKSHQPPRTGRHYKVWSKLTAKDKEERVVEYRLYHVATRAWADIAEAQQDMKPFDVYWQEVLTDEDVDKWKSKWSSPLGLFIDKNQRDATTSDAAAGAGQKQPNKRQQRSQQISEMRDTYDDLIDVLIDVASARVPRTRQKILDECLRHYNMPVPLILQQQLLKAIDKLYKQC